MSDLSDLKKKGNEANASSRGERHCSKGDAPFDQSAEIRRSLEEDHAFEAPVYSCHSRRPPPPRTTSVRAPSGSLQFLATRLEKTTRQVRRYCELGLVPGAVKTDGGHWRIPENEETVELVRIAISGSERKVVNLEKDRDLRDALVKPGDDELLGGRNALRMRGYEYDLFCALFELKRLDEPYTVKNIAAKSGISISTLYRRIRRKKLREIIEKFEVQGSAIFDQTVRGNEFRDIGKNSRAESDDW